LPTEAAVLDVTTLESVSRLFRVLAEPTRLDLLQHLKAGPITVSELIDATGQKQANVSKQLGILFTAGLVSRERDGNLVRYAIADPMVFDLCELVCGKLRADAERQLAGLPKKAKARRG
jgi:DNA-binding transcriptional ArsR family regulator